MSDNTITAGDFPDRLKHYENARVHIHYGDGQHTDTGRLVFLDDAWAELVKDNGEHLLIPAVAIRIIKLLKPAEAHNEANILLRAAEAQPKQITGEK